MFDSLQPHGLQYARLPCPPSSPRVCSNSCPLSWWCHPTQAISSSVVPFSFCLQCFPASGSFPMSWLFTSGSQSIGASPSASVLPMNIQGWFPLGLISLIALQSKGISSFFQHHSSKASIFRHSAFFMVQCSHPYMTTGKTMAFINVFHWRWEWQITSVSLLGEPQESMKRQKDMTPEDEPLGW